MLLNCLLCVWKGWCIIESYLLEYTLVKSTIPFFRCNVCVWFLALPLSLSLISVWFNLGLHWFLWVHTKCMSNGNGERSNSEYFLQNSSLCVFPSLFRAACMFSHFLVIAICLLVVKTASIPYLIKQKTLAPTIISWFCNFMSIYDIIIMFVLQYLLAACIQKHRKCEVRCTQSHIRTLAPSNCWLIKRVSKSGVLNYT